MAAPGRWIRLNVLWEESDWIEALDGTARGCWPRLLCMVKRDGVRGRCERPPMSKLTKKWAVPAEAIEAMERAAVEDGALEIDGEGCWVVTNWPKYQEPDSTRVERQRRHREKQSAAANLSVVVDDAA